jgi:cryptochrome
VTKDLGKIEDVAPTPEALPDPVSEKLEYDRSKYDNYKWPHLDVNEHIRTGNDICYGKLMSGLRVTESQLTRVEKLLGPDDDYSVPTMAQMGYEESTTSIRGGTDEAHECLKRFLSQPDKVATFSKPKTAPTSLEPSTTLLSPYMKFGCIGVREIWWGCKEVIKNWKGKGETKEPENMFGQVSQPDGR